MNELGKQIVEELKKDISQEQEDLISAVKTFLEQNYPEVLEHKSDKHTDIALNSYLIEKAKKILNGQNGEIHERIIYALAVEFYTTPVKEITKTIPNNTDEKTKKEVKQETEKVIKGDPNQFTFDLGL